MSNKNIKQNHFLQVKKILDQVDKQGDNANHFRAIVLMGDQRKQEAYSYIHAPQEDMENLLLHAIRTDDLFAYSVAKAMERYIEEKEQQQSNNSQTDKEHEENHI